jgi:succinate-semialdehyde dehydrogenase/glutarate-semialdehyde dehydrogenase
MRSLNIKKDTIFSINPATLETVGEVKITTPESVETAVRTAWSGFPGWRDLGLFKRAEVIKSAQQLFLDRKEEVARLITLEMGRPFCESLVLEVQSSIDLMGYYARRAKKLLEDRRVPLHSIFFRRRESILHFEPLGVLGIICPWNWPLLIPLGGIVPALLSGNGVVFKPSEITPLTGELIREFFLDAGVPENIFQIVHGVGTTGSALVNSSVEKIFFTGSTEVGQKVMEQAAIGLKKSVLEMGGNDPAIICDDADQEITSSGMVWGGYSNCGQNCNGIERIYVHESIADSVIDNMLKKIKRLRVGNGMESHVDIGPLASEMQLKKIEAIVKNADEMGAECLTGGQRIKGLPGYFFEPTLYLWNRSISRPPDQEIFGPVVYITPVKDDEEAVQLSNNSTFGLTASVWTENVRRGREVAHLIEAGTVMINDVIVSFGITEASWTGIKNSGIGWVHGEKGLDEMVNIKYINRDPQSHSQKFWWFPYSQDMLTAIRAGMNFLFARNLKRRISGVLKVIRFFSGYLLLNRKRSDKL